MSHEEAAALVSANRNPGVIAGIISMLTAVFRRRSVKQAQIEVREQAPTQPGRRAKPAKTKRETVYRHLQGYKQIELKGPAARRKVGVAGLATGYRSRTHSCKSVG